jgi:hypothetical protein
MLKKKTLPQELADAVKIVEEYTAKAVKPTPWWEEYLGLKIRWPEPLKPKRVWYTTLYYAAWIVPTALLTMVGSWSASWFGWQPQVPVQARPKEAHVPSQVEFGPEASNVFEAVAVSGNPIQVFAADAVRVDDEESGSVFVRTYTIKRPSAATLLQSPPPSDSDKA